MKIQISLMSAILTFASGASPAIASVENIPSEKVLSASLIDKQQLLVSGVSVMMRTHLVSPARVASNAISYQKLARQIEGIALDPKIKDDQRQVLLRQGLTECSRRLNQQLGSLGVFYALFQSTITSAIADVERLIEAGDYKNVAASATAADRTLKSILELTK